RSSDGAGWTVVNNRGSRIGSVIFADGSFFGYSDDAAYVSTSAGQTWDARTQINGPVGSVTTGLLSGARIFVGAGPSTADTKTSTNGLAWTITAHGDGPAYTSFVFAGY